jgi:hypothetical protein
MNRRDFLSKAAAVGASTFLCGRFFTPKLLLAQTAADEKPVYAGWEYCKVSRSNFISKNQYPFLNQLNQDIRGTGAGKQAFLWKYLEEVTGQSLKPHFQETGDCVSHGYGLGIDVLTAIQIRMKKSPQKWVAPAATEIIYGGGRIEIGQNLYRKNWRGEGLNGVCAAEFLKKYGVLIRQSYFGGKYDFTTYSGDRASEYGRQGVPDDLEPLCKLHPVGWAALVQNWSEARDCIYNGYPVILCSNQGFKTKYGLDKDGFLVPGAKPWWHCMLLAGIDDSFSRPGGLIINSWGDWIDGPKRHEQPAGSFWADASVIDRICKQGDTIAISSYAGYPRQDYILW